MMQFLKDFNAKSAAAGYKDGVPLRVLLHCKPGCFPPFSLFELVDKARPSLILRCFCPLLPGLSSELLELVTQ